MRDKILGTLVALALFFAGCVASEDDAAPGEQAQAPIEADFTEDTGSILGQILNEAQLPVPGASVGIIQPPIQTVADEEGRFALNRVAPGTYTVLANALGFQQAGKQVTVEAGRVTEGIVFALNEMPSDAPYHKVNVEKLQLGGVMWKLTPDCIYTDTNPGGVYTLKTCGGLRMAGCDACETHFGFDEVTLEWKTILGELTWVPQSGFTGRGFNFDVNAPNIPRGTGGSISPADGHQWTVNTDEAPIQIRIDNPTTLEERGIPPEDWYPYENNDCPAEGDNNCDWFYRVFPAYCDLGNCEEGFGPDYGIMYESTAEAYFTYFIREPAPEGFSALPEE